MGPLLPDQNEPAKHGQIYFLGPNEQFNRRGEVFCELSRNLIWSIQCLLHEINPYVQIYQHASHFLNRDPSSDLRIVFLQHRIIDPMDIRRYNQPTVQEVAAIVSGTDRDRISSPREIHIYKKNPENSHPFQIISDDHDCYDPLHYVLMHPYGSRGWAPNLYEKYHTDLAVINNPIVEINNNNLNENNNNNMNENNNFIENNIFTSNNIQNQENDYDLNLSSTSTNSTDSNLLIDTSYNEINDNNLIDDDEDDYADDHVAASSHQSRYVSCCEFYSNKLMRLSDDQSIFHYFGRLYQQYIVDNYLKIEHQKLKYLQFNQDRLRVDLYRGIVDAFQVTDTNLADTGRRLILPSSYVGGPRYMLNLFQDAMAIVRHYGKPDLFITVTCNPNWPEILAELKPGQTPQDIPDIVSRVFRLKLKDIMDVLINKGILGKVDAHMYTIEFQKRVNLINKILILNTINILIFKRVYHTRIYY